MFRNFHKFSLKDRFEINTNHRFDSFSNENFVVLKLFCFLLFEAVSKALATADIQYCERLREFSTTVVPR